MAFLKTFFLVSFLQFIFSFCSFSQSDSVRIYKLSDVVVTATRTETSSLEVASSITVIDSAEIANSKKIFLYDILKSEPGIIFTQQGGSGKFASVYTRGGNPGHTLVLMDGIEINMPNDPGNTVDFATLPVEDINRVEILRGPQSTLYGSEALAGVINIISHKGAGKPKFYLNSSGGSYNTFAGTAGLSGDIGIFNYALSAGRVSTDGFSSASEAYGNTEKDGHSGWNLFTRVGTEIVSGTELSLIYRHNKAETDYDQFGGAFGDDPTYIFNLEENIFRTELNTSFLDGMIESKAGVSYFKNVRKYSYDSIASNPVTSTSFYDGSKIKIDLQNNLKFSENYTIILGIETEEEKAYSEYFSTSFNSIIPDNSVRTSGLYMQGQAKFFESLYCAAGLRYDSRENFSSGFTYRIAPAYIFWETGTKLKATFGTGFNAPSIFYLYDPAFGNTELNPEKSIGWDAGIEQYLFGSGVIAGFTYFSNTFKDLFGFDQSFRTINIKKAETKGVELFIKALPIDEFEIKANYSFTSAKDLSEGVSDNELIRRPKHKAALNLNYRVIEPLNTNLEVIYVGEREDDDFSQFPAVRITLKSYTLVNLAASFDIFKYLQIYGRVENLLDADYEEVYGYGTPGLSFYGGIRLGI